MSKSEPKDRQPRERDETFTGKFTHRWVEATKPMEQEVQYAERLKKGLSLMLYQMEFEKAVRSTFFRGSNVDAVPPHTGN